jgi:hypothetical protein
MKKTDRATTKSGKPKHIPRHVLEIGWREHVGLPDLGIAEMPAKIDTGARTSALHTTRLRTFEKDGEPWIRFCVPLGGGHSRDIHTARIVDHRDIKNTSGEPEKRYVIETTLVLGTRHWTIEVSLADRTKMSSDLILGRSAVRRHRLLVNPGRSFLLGPPKYKKGPRTRPYDSEIRTE